MPMHAHAASHGRALARAAALTRSCSGARHCCTTHPPGKCVAHATAGALTGKEVLLPWGMPCNTALRARVQAGCCQRKRGGAILASRRTVRAPAPQQGCAGGARVEAIAGWVALGRRRRVPGSSGRLQRGGGGGQQHIPALSAMRSQAVRVIMIHWVAAPPAATKKVHKSGEGASRAAASRSSGPGPGAPPGPAPACMGSWRWTGTRGPQTWRTGGTPGARWTGPAHRLARAAGDQGERCCIALGRAVCGVFVHVSCRAGRGCERQPPCRVHVTSHAATAAHRAHMAGWTPITHRAQLGDDPQAVRHAAAAVSPRGRRRERVAGLQRLARGAAVQRGASQAGHLRHRKGVGRMRRQEG